MHESTLLYLITLIELLIHIESEQHSLRVLTPKETTKDKFVNMLVSKITNHRMDSPLNVCIYCLNHQANVYTLFLTTMGGLPCIVFMVHK